VAALGQALAAGLHRDRDELMAVTAAYSGLRWGELAALTTGQVDPAARVIPVDRKIDPFDANKISRVGRCGWASLDS